MNFKELTKTITVNGVKVVADITVRVAQDDITPEGDFDFGDAGENAKYLKRFKSGELFIGVVSVEATAHGESGVDILGGCHLFSNNYFDSKPFNKSVNEVVKSHSMIDNALKDLERALTSRAQALKQFIKEDSNG